MQRETNVYEYIKMFLKNYGLKMDKHFTKAAAHKMPIIHVACLKLLT